jgi:hypothetical protein
MVKFLQDKLQEATELKDYWFDRYQNTDSKTAYSEYLNWMNKEDIYCDILEEYKVTSKKEKRNMKLPTQKEIRDKALKEIFEEKNIKLVIMQLELRAIEVRMKKAGKDKDKIDMLKGKREDILDAIENLSGSIKVIKEEAKSKQS